MGGGFQIKAGLENTHVNRVSSVCVFASCTYGGSLLPSFSFVVFKPLAYGMTGPRADDPKSSMYGLKWLSTWEI